MSIQSKVPGIINHICSSSKMNGNAIVAIVSSLLSIVLLCSNDSTNNSAPYHRASGREYKIPDINVLLYDIK